MILASVDGFFQFLPKLVEEKVSSGTEKTGKNHGKNHPLEETANPVNFIAFSIIDVTVLRLALYHFYPVLCGVEVSALAYRSQHSGFKSS